MRVRKGTCGCVCALHDGGTRRRTTHFVAADGRIIERGSVEAAIEMFGAEAVAELIDV